MNKKLLLKLSAVLLCLTLISCGQDTNQTTNSSANTSSIDFEEISFAQWSDKLAGYQSNIVVVDLWASWCLPCIKRFPKMVTMSHKYADKNVSFVSINFDDPEDGESLQKAEEFLNEVKADFDNFYFSDNLIDTFENLEVIALPTVVIYDAEGKEYRRLTNTNPNQQFSGADIEKVIDKLLAGG